MDSQAKNYRSASIGALRDIRRETLHDVLELTGAEISVNRLAAGTASPFVHSHKLNEEVYLFLEGRGLFQVDGEQFAVAEGSVVRVDPAGKRGIKAADDADLSYICVQATACSLTQFTRTDGVIHEGAPIWK